MSTSTTDPLETKQRKKRRLIANFDTTRQQEIRQANRIAARVCRKRKKNVAKELEGSFHSLCTENKLLSSQYETLSVWVTQLKMSRPAQQEQSSSTNSTSTNANANNKNYREETESTEMEQSSSSNYPKQDEDSFNDAAQFLASASPFQDQEEEQDKNEHENGDHIINNNTFEILTQAQAASPDFSTAYNAALQNQTTASYNPSLQNQGLSQPPPHPTLLFQQQQQQQQNFSLALFPGMFGTNTNVLPMQQMQHPTGVAGPPGQISSMLTIAPPVLSNPQNVSTVPDFQQQLALLGNQNLALGQLLSQNPSLMLGGWNGMTADQMQFQQQVVGGNNANTQQQSSQDFSWPNASYHQQPP